MIETQLDTIATLKEFPVNLDQVNLLLCMVYTYV